MTRETIDLDELDLPQIINRRTAEVDRSFLPFGVQDDQLVPDFLPIGGERLVSKIPPTHGTDGYITTDPEQIAKIQKRLDDKLQKNISAFTYYDEYEVPGAKTLVIAAYG